MTIITRVCVNKDCDQYQIVQDFVSYVELETGTAILENDGECMECGKFTMQSRASNQYGKGKHAWTS